MNSKNVLPILVLCAGFNGCGGSSSTPGANNKKDGPDVRGMSPTELAAVLKECIKFGRMDDPRVVYTPQYCSAVMSAHLGESYATPAKSAAEPAVTRIH